MREFVSIAIGKGQVPVYLAAPERGAPGAAIVLLFHRDGIDDFTKTVVERLAGQGYLVAVPDVYHRCPSETPPKERKALLSDREVVADVAATADFLCARGDVAADRVVVMGHCMGGRMALLAAGRLPRFRACIVYYGGSVNRSWGDGPTPFETLRNIDCPVLGFFGNLDKHPSPADVDQIDAELTAHAVPHVFHRYPDAGHGFQNPQHSAPAERAASEDAWEKTLAFLRETVG
ncbi:MAG TPA: alpha/beta fold hydrolase [Micropepsaceae bacterium]|nr:alpha/beta fold hydrolase [Micropepsaceae bacterium]